MGRVLANAASAGVKLETLYASVAALTLQGVNANEAVTGANALISKIANPTEQSLAIAKNFGIEINSTAMEAMGLSKYLEDVFNKVNKNNKAKVEERKQIQATITKLEQQKKQYESTIRAITSNSSGAKAKKAQMKNALLSVNEQIKTSKKSLEGLKQVGADVNATIAKLFGSDQAAMAAKILGGKGKQAFQDIEKEMYKNGATDFAYEKNTEDNPQVEIDKAKASMEVLATTVGESLQDELQKTLQMLNPLLAKLIEFTEANPELTGQITEIAGALAILGLLSKPLTFLFKTFKFLLKPVKAIFTLLGVGGTAIAGIVLGVAALTQSLFTEDRTNFLSKFIDSIPGAKEFIDTLFDAFLIGWEKLKTMGSDGWEWIKEKCNEGWEWLKEMLMLPFHWLGTKFDELKEMGIYVWEEMTVKIVEWKDKLIEIFKDVVNIISYPFRTFLAFIIEGLNKIIGGLNSIDLRIPDFVPIYGGEILVSKNSIISTT